MNNLFILTNCHPRSDVRIFKKYHHTFYQFTSYNLIYLVADGKGNDFSKRQTIIDFGLSKNRFLRLLKTFTMFFYLIKVKAKNIHFHDPELLISMYLYKKLFSKTRMIYDMHENILFSIPEKKHLNRLYRFFAKNFLKVFLPICLKKMKIIFAENSYKFDYPYVVDFLEVLNYPLAHPPHSVKNIEGKTRFNLLYVGANSPSRGFYFMLEILRKLDPKKYHLTLIGDLTEIEEFNEPIPPNVEILKFIPFDKCQTYFEKADLGLCLLNPIVNYNLSYSTKIFDYMAMGIPCLFSNCKINQQFDNKIGYMVNFANVDEAIQKIESLLGAPKIYHDFSSLGIFLTKEKYQWNFQEKQIIDFFFDENSSLNKDESFH